MPDLTIVACPTCGLPAELLTLLESEPPEGDGPHLVIRCLDHHVAIIPLTPASGEVEASIECPRPGGIVLPFPPSPRFSAWTRIRGVVAAARPKSWRPLWFAFGALAAVLLLEAPLVALVLLPISLPVYGVARARRAWRPVFPVARSVPLPPNEPAERPATGEAGCEAA